MSVYDDLNRVQISEARYKECKQALVSFPMLCDSLAQTTKPEELMELLFVEISNENRYSYIARIYGRYRRLLPSRDLELIQQFRREAKLCQNSSEKRSMNLT